MQTLDINPGELDNDIRNLVRKLKKLDLDPEKTQIIAIGRGGFMPAQYVAYGLDIRNLTSIQSVMYEDQEKKEHSIAGVFFLDYDDFDNFIIVDDIYDTGETMDNVVDLITDAINSLAEKPIEIIPAVIYTRYKKKKMKKKNIIFGRRTPTVYGENPWLIFPWDRMGQAG